MADIVIRKGDTTQVDFVLYNYGADGNKTLFSEAEINSLTGATALVLTQVKPWDFNSPVVEVTKPYTDKDATISTVRFKLDGTELDYGFYSARVKCVFGDGNQFTTIEGLRLKVV